ncbi:MAG: hypothetical protein ACOYVJ_05250 [Nitrospirota bacterium]
MREQEKYNKEIFRKYRVCQSRQLLAIAVTLVLLLFLTLIYKRYDLFGEVSRHTIFVGQLLIIGGFIGFSAINWRCPCCKKYLGADIGRRVCKKCGAKLRQ